MEKKCEYCGELFESSNSRKKYCSNQCKDKKYRQENPEYYKKYYQENSDKIKERSKKYRQENSDKIKKINKKYRQENPDKEKENCKKYYWENKDKIKESMKDRYFTIKKYWENLSEKKQLELMYKRSQEILNDPSFKPKTRFRQHLLVSKEKNKENINKERIDERLKKSYKEKIWKEKMKKYLQEYNNIGKGKKQIVKMEKKCEYCGELFESFEFNTKFCSNQCKDKKNQEKNKENINKEIKEFIERNKEYFKKENINERIKKSSIPHLN